jgi:hypothetical protein
MFTNMSNLPAPDGATYGASGALVDGASGALVDGASGLKPDFADAAQRAGPTEKKTDTPLFPGKAADLTDQIAKRLTELVPTLADENARDIAAMMVFSALFAFMKGNQFHEIDQMISYFFISPYGKIPLWMVNDKPQGKESLLTFLKVVNWTSDSTPDVWGAIKSFLIATQSGFPYPSKTQDFKRRNEFYVAFPTTWTQAQLYGCEWEQGSRPHPFMKESHAYMQILLALKAEAHTCPSEELEAKVSELITTGKLSDLQEAALIAILQNPRTNRRALVPYKESFGNIPDRGDDAMSSNGADEQPVGATELLQKHYAKKATRGGRGGGYGRGGGRGGGPRRGGRGGHRGKSNVRRDGGYAA